MKVSRFRRVRDSLPTFVAGASLGALLTWVFTRGRPRTGAVVSEVASTSGAGEAERTRWTRALGESLRSARERRGRGGVTGVDLTALRSAVDALPGTEHVQLCDLGDGIVEAIGTAPDADTVGSVLAALRAGEGVSVVVNRIWTPASAGERKADLSHIRRTRGDSSVN